MKEKERAYFFQKRGSKRKRCRQKEMQRKIVGMNEEKRETETGRQRKGSTKIW